MADVPELSARVWSALARAGWSPDRAWDTRAVAEAHEARGLVLHEAARSFLSRFGGLQIERALDTRALSALEAASDARLEDAASWIGESLSVVGRVDAAQTLLFVSERGTFWAHTGKLVVSHGTDAADALERYCPGAAPTLN